MTQQFSDTIRNYWADGYESQIGPEPKLRVYTGDPPANCAAAASGTQLGEGTADSDWLTAASGGSKSLIGTWAVTMTAAGTIGYYRIYNNAGSVCHEQGKVGQSKGLSLSAQTNANSNVLTFADTAGVTVGLAVSGSGVPADAVAREVTATTVTMSCAPSVALPIGTVITFGTPGASSDMRLANPSVVAGQVITVSAKTLTMPGA